VTLRDPHNVLRRVLVLSRYVLRGFNAM